jgi:uncharacterized protein YjbI with pentapeptide repeats
VRFEHCTLDGSNWINCHFKDVHAVDCSFIGTRNREGNWIGGAIRRSNLERSEWENMTLERVSLEDCQLTDVRFARGAWSMILLQGGGGGQGLVRDVKVDSASWYKVDAPDWTWSDAHIDGLGLVESRMPRLKMSKCTLVKSGVLSTDLSGSELVGSSFTFTVFSQGTSLEEAHISDCVFEASSWQDLHADHVRVDHCTFAQHNAQRLEAGASCWTRTVLDGVNATHAHFSEASFDHCSLKGAMLYGADMRQSQIWNCNLIHAKTSWILPPEAGAWRDNLVAGQIDVPRRGL